MKTNWPINDSPIQRFDVSTHSRWNSETLNPLIVTNGGIVATSPPDFGQIRAKMKKLGLTEESVPEAVRWARSNGNRISYYSGDRAIV